MRWIEEAAPGAEEPEHPAPVLKLTAADASTDSGHGSPGASATANAAPTASAAPTANAAATSASSDSNDGLTYAALAVGLVALLLSGVTLARGSRGTST